MYLCVAGFLNILISNGTNKYFCDIYFFLNMMKYEYSANKKYKLRICLLNTYKYGIRLLIVFAFYVSHDN